MELVCVCSLQVRRSCSCIHCYCSRCSPQRMILYVHCPESFRGSTSTSSTFYQYQYLIVHHGQSERMCGVHFAPRGLHSTSFHFRRAVGVGGTSFGNHPLTDKDVME